MADRQPAVWFPVVRTGTGTDVFTERLATALRARGVRADVTWLPLRAEYAPWTVPVPAPPKWATLCHVNTWLHPRFIPGHLPVVATLHHSIHDPALQPYKGRLRAAYHRCWIAPIERRVMRRAHQVLAVSQFVADMAGKTLCDVPMQVVYNGIDTALFQPGSRVRKPDGAFRLLYVGSWKALKGVDMLAPIMRELGEGFELQFTGGPVAQKEKLTMPPNMHDLGRLSELQVVSAMQDADAFLFPSRSEGFGLVAAEAMACGLPVIATKGTAIAELVQDGDAGLLCLGDSVGDFAQAVRRLANDRDLLSKFSAAAVASARSRFGYEQMVASYLEIYRRTVVAGARSASLR